jgi:hypothetical protein
MRIQKLILGVFNVNYFFRQKQLSLIKHHLHGILRVYSVAAASKRASSGCFSPMALVGSAILPEERHLDVVGVWIARGVVRPVDEGRGTEARVSHRHVQARDVEPRLHAELNLG